MTPVFRGILILVSIFATWMILRKIRDAKLQIEDSVFWVFFSAILIIFSVFPRVADILSDLVGTYSTSNFIFLLIIFLLFVKVFYMSIHISQLETKLRELIQKIALDENRIQREKIKEKQEQEQQNLVSSKEEQGEEVH